MKKISEMCLMELKEFYELTENDKAWAGKALEDIYQCELDIIDAYILELIPELVNKAEEIMADTSKECVEAYNSKIYGEENVRLMAAMHLRYSVTSRVLTELGILTPERVKEIYNASKNEVLDQKTD